MLQRAAAAGREITKGAKRENAYRPFVVAGLVLAVAGGFVLAIALPVDAALGYSLGPRWPALAQAHGHLQAVGFAGLFILGLALRLTPRFAGRPLAFPNLTLVILGLVLAGVVLRSAAQPFADGTAGRVGSALAAALVLAGAACFLATALPPVWSALRRREAFAPFFLAGAVWFAVQALLSLIWLADLREGQRIVPPVRNELLLALQFFGFHLSFILGVASRALPALFAVERRDWRQAWLVCAVLQVGLVAFFVARLSWIGGSGPVTAAEGIALVMVAAAFALGTLPTGFWRKPDGLRPPAQPVALLLRLAMIWLIVAAGALSWFGVQAVAEGRVLTHLEMDTVRHLIALGVVTTLIMGMGHLILPEFATERLSATSRARRIRLLGAALALAVVLRTVDGLAGNWVEGDASHWLLAASGSIGFGAVVAFAALYAQALLRQPMLLWETSQRVLAPR